jgi:hypothetical protein
MCQRGTCLSYRLSSHFMHFPLFQVPSCHSHISTDRRNRQYALIWREATVSLSNGFRRFHYLGVHHFFSEAVTRRLNRRLRLDCKRDSTAVIPSPE